MGCFPMIGQVLIVGLEHVFFPSCVWRKDQDETSVALAQSQQKAITVGKTALSVEGKIPFEICFAENIVRRGVRLAQRASR